MKNHEIVGALLAALLIAACGDDTASGGAAQGGGATGGAASGGGATGGSAQGGASGSFEAVHGAVCAPETLIGTIRIHGFPQAPRVDGDLWDGPSPFIGAPELANETCAYYHYQPACAACDPGTICDASDVCVPERRTIKDATLDVTVGADAQSLAADPTLGNFSADLTVGDASAAYGMRLAFGGIEITLAPLAYEAGPLPGATLTTEGPYDMPGALDVTWTPTATGWVLSTIPINHHAQAGTFTFCAAPGTAGAFHADAEMIDPLAVITGLEFQGVEYVGLAAAETPLGCVEFRFGEQQFL